MRYVRPALRVLLGALFMVSAVAKLFAIDDFELYVFSYGFFSLNFTYVLVRLCIAAELALGVLTALGWWRRVVRLLDLGMLLFFSLFLCYASLVGRNESCQCFGRLADLNPVQSLLKNALLIVIALLAFDKGKPVQHCKLRAWLTALIVAASLATPFVVSVPDSWMFGPEDARYNKELLQETVAERNLDGDRYVVSFVTPGCPYCRMSRQKIGSIASRNDLDTTRIVYIEPDDIGADRFLQLTYGQRPLILMLDHGQTVATFHYRNISERSIVDFLGKD